MKRRIMLILIAVLLVTAFALTFTACDKALVDPGTGETTYTMDFATVYAMAEEAGYQGTMEDLIREFKGEAGTGISKIEKVGTEGLVDTYKITFTDGNSLNFNVTNGAEGAPGQSGPVGPAGPQGPQGPQGTPGAAGAAGRGISKIEKIASEGLVDTYKITFTNNTEFTFDVTNGASGENGVGIASVEKTGREGLVDIYTITLTNGNTYDFTVTNGKDGKDAVLPEFDPDGATPYFYFNFNLLSNDTYEISARYQNMPSRLVVPAVYEGKAVSEIAEGAFRGRTSITEVVIPTSIVSLHRHAFEDCTNLKIVTFEEGSLLTSIGSLDAFAGCPIEIATIPSLADTAVGNDAIKTVKYIMNGGSYHITMTGYHAFENCKNLTSVTFAADTKMIGVATFKNCPALTSVVIPVGTTMICDEAFMGTGLTWISLPDSVTTIGDDAFSACYSLSSAYLSSGLTEIPDRLFAYCSSLTTANIPAGVTSIGDFAFFDCDLYSCTIPAGVTSIGRGAFNGCNRLVFVCNLSSLPIEKGSLAYGGIGSNVIDLYTEAGRYPNSAMLSDYFVVRIEDEETLLIGYIGKQEIVWIPDEVTAINNNAFFGNDTIKQVHIGKNVKSIGKTAFCGCDNLTTVTIEKGLTKIDTQAFFDCANLTSIVIPSTVTSISTSAFMKCPSLVSIIVVEGNDTYYSQGNCVIERNTLRVICGCKTSVIPEDAKRIWWYSFEDCLGLYSVSIPDSVMSISQSAFRQCRDLVEVKIGSGVTLIDARAFEYCTSLRAIAIPVNVKVIAENAFAHCDLFTDVYYKGTKAEWAKVDVDESAIDSEVIIHCSDGIYGEE